MRIILNNGMIITLPINLLEIFANIVVILSLVIAIECLVDVPLVDIPDIKDIFTITLD